MQHGRLRGVRGAVLVLAAVAAITAQPALSARPSTPKAPSGLAFYSPPARLLAGTPGTVIWSRAVAYACSALTSAASRATLVLCRSCCPGHGKPTAVSGLVFTPRGHAAAAMAGG